MARTWYPVWKNSDDLERVKDGVEAWKYSVSTNYPTSKQEEELSRLDGEIQIINEKLGNLYSDSIVAVMRK